MHERRSKVKKELDDPSHPNESKLNSSREREPLIPKTGRISCPDVLGRDGPTVPGQLLAQSGEIGYPMAEDRGREGRLSTGRRVPWCLRMEC